MPKTSREWISYRQAAQQIGKSYVVVDRLVSQGVFQVRRLPFCRPEIRASDVRRVLAESVTNAGEKACV